MLNLISAGLSIAGGVFEGMSAKSNYKAQKQQLEKQKEIGEKEYAYNMNNLNETTLDNLQINYSNSANNLFELSKEYMEASSQANLLSSGYDSGLAFSSAKGDLQRQLENEYKMLIIKNAENTSLQEEALTEAYTNSKTQLALEKYKADVGLEAQFTNAKNEYKSSMFSSIVNSGLGVNSMLNEFGGGFK